MSAVCPACGVAVVPGYVKCPRCHAGLPRARARRTTGDPGGTAVQQGGFPVLALVVAVGVAAVIILGFRMRSATRPAPVAGAVLPGPAEAASEPRVVAAPILPAPVVVAAPATAPASALDPDRRATATGIENMLRQQRLWGRVEILGDRMDIRSGSCGDPAMRSTIDAMGSELRGAGLTRLRCVAQSGAIVFERAL